MKIDIVGSGKIYIAPSGVDRSLIMSDEYFAGETCSDSAFMYYKSNHIASDERGNTVRIISHSHSAIFTGRFIQLDTDMIYPLLGISNESNSLNLTSSPSDNEIQFLFSNTSFEDGEKKEYQIYIKGRCTSGLSMTFSNTHSKGIAFEIHAVCEDGGCCVEFGLV